MAHVHTSHDMHTCDRLTREQRTLDGTGLYISRRPRLEQPLPHLPAPAPPSQGRPGMLRSPIPARTIHDTLTPLTLTWVDMRHTSRQRHFAAPVLTPSLLAQRAHRRVGEEGLPELTLVYLARRVKVDRLEDLLHKLVRLVAARDHVRLQLVL